ncbi:hypothetical protein EDD18DRAFT_1116093 [Armillaria luteobubalina]|uniref:Uncharacterized protein n=1 Tax=Armillaria luteobubalina TaxID=153913 RepID=A0AA39U114_9AGAR|nr:hypothetical protein EDD18DRAFT_1116093 [Armillaria luteobubalina]
MRGGPHTARRRRGWWWCGGGINGIVLVVVETSFLLSGGSSRGVLTVLSRHHSCSHRSVALVVCIVEALFLPSSRHCCCHLQSVVLVVFKASFLSSSSWACTQACCLHASAFIASALDADLPHLSVHLRFDAPLSLQLYHPLIDLSAAAIVVPVLVFVIGILVVLVIVPSPMRCRQPVEAFKFTLPSADLKYSETCASDKELFNLEQGPSQAANTAQDLHLDSQRDLASSPSFEPGSSEDESDNSSSDDVTDAANAILDQMTDVEMMSSFIDKPWHPFASENDFELAELILRTGMNHQERDSYFKVLKTQAGDHQSAYTINNESDLNDAWSQAEHLLVMLDEKTNTRMRIFDEPWTGDLLWKIQSSLPPGGKPLAYILYADKTRLSSFGTAKGYPVMARIANLPDAICNGKGWGGGTVVGWLPIVEEDPKHKGKPSWSMDQFQILESVAEYSYTGYAFTLPHSRETIVIYRFIFILSADYEEHCMMSLICGVRSSCPCPVCLVPDKKLMDITEVYPLRTTENMQKLYDQAQEKGDSILQSSGLQDVENVFWSMEHSDPYRAVSWDRLHAYHLGLFKCLLLRLLEYVENIQGPDKHKAKVIIDEFITNFPRWQNLIHFPNQILFAAHSVLSKADNTNAYLLLKVIRSYLELDMYTSMDVHTEKSIEEGRQLLGVFEANLKAYSRATDDTIWKNVTSWSIPKGVTKNYNTKVNECMHGPLKEAYQTRTNFKNVADQILMTDHRYGIAMKLQQRMDRNKKHQKEAMASVEQETKVSSKAKCHNCQMQNIQPLDSKASLHSLRFTPRDPHTLEELEAAFHSDPAYEHFQIRLGLFMTTFLNMVEKGTVAAGKFIQYRPNDMSISKSPPIYYAVIQVSTTIHIMMG